MSNAVDFEIQADLTDVKEFGGEGGFAPALPPGEFVFDLVEMTEETSKKQNKMLVVTFKVAEGEYAGVDIKGYYTLTPKAMGRIKKLALACGASLNKIAKAEYVGARIFATVIHQPGQQQLNPDGTPKSDANGVPYEPSMFAKVCNERPLEEPEPAPAPTPPPVTKAKAANGQATRRA